MNRIKNEGLKERFNNETGITLSIVSSKLNGRRLS